MHLVGIMTSLFWVLLQSQLSYKYNNNNNKYLELYIKYGVCETNKTGHIQMSSTILYRDLLFSFLDSKYNPSSVDCRHTWRLYTYVKKLSLTFSHLDSSDTQYFFSFYIKENSKHFNSTRVKLKSYKSLPIFVDYPQKFILSRHLK